MTSFIVISLAALLSSLLTFFSGFGLGTILLPCFALFFPLEQAIALTGVVHFLNNAFKTGLVGKHIAWKVILKFGVTAFVGAFLGAKLLVYLTGDLGLITYHLMGYELSTSYLKIAVSSMMFIFAALELFPNFNGPKIEEKHLPYGGFLSGFFGGLSGHQGALRSAFLIKCNLEKNAFIATGVFISMIVDVSRLSIYFNNFQKSDLIENIPLLSTAVLSAFIGAYFGKKLLQKVTIKFLQVTVSIMIILISILMGFGII